MSRVCHLLPVYQTLPCIGNSNDPTNTAPTLANYNPASPRNCPLHLAQRIQQSSPPEQGRRSWLARSVNHFVLVCEAVETGSRALCVSSHVLEGEPVADVQ
jgi:hypothetical protein